MLLIKKFNIIFKSLFIVLLILSCNKEKYELKQGDILFQDLDKDSIDSAIEKVTKTSLNYNFTHVAIVVEENHTLKILEAITTGVQITPISTFLKRNLKNNKPKVVVGKLNPKFSNMINDAITYGKSLIGSPYDNIYKIGNNTYYCSELIYEMFHHANPNITTFQLQPMTFKNSETNQVLEFWKDYYQKLNSEIPEGKLGLNPNGMAVSPNITLVYDYVTEKKLTNY